MSRIIRAPVDAGQVITAADLNNTYNDYNQPGALQADNTRDQAFDLPHFQNVVIVKNSQVNVLGNTGMLHTAPVTTVASELAAPIAVHPVQTSTGTETRMTFGANGWVLALGDCLRVWWNLSLKCYYTGSPWNNGSALGRYNIPDTTPPGNVVISDGFHCWLAYLQWDTTSAALTNWVAVQGQSDPTTIGAYEGFYTQYLNAGTVISPWTISSFAFADNGAMPAGNNGKGFNHEWFAPYGMFVFAPTIAPVTVYGIRLVITGILHSGHLAAGNQENVLLYDYNVGDPAQYLEYKGGRISAVHQRVA
jgi:hypothetical protein